MRIALCSDSFLPIMDGVGRVVYTYARMLAERGHECYVVTPINNKAGYRGGFPFEIVDFLSLPTPTGAQYRTGIATLDPHYIERIHALRFDLVHVHSPSTAGLEGIRLAGLQKIPLVGTFHSKYYDDILKITHMELLASMGAYTVASFYRRCDDVWTVSENAAQTLREYGYDGDVRVMRNGCALRSRDPADERRAREAFNLGDAPILLYVGQIDCKKNLPRILEAAALLKARGRPFQLVFAGQGVDRKKLEAQAETAELPCVFTGHVTDTALLDGLYAAASLFVFPSLYDTAGLVIGEAAAMGTPSVVVKNTAPAELIRNGENGLLCTDEAQSLADAIEQYLFALTPAQRAHMGEQARLTLPQDWAAVMDAVEARYQSLLEKNGGKV